MRIAYVLVLLLALAALVSANWDKDDYEIFELQAALEKDEGDGANFYSFFNLTRTATAAQIRKAYRARSMELHPDKHAGTEGAARRFERLGVINKILRDHRRDRYDHFLTNGFPKWRGSGYFYARYRPGLGSVCVFLILVTAAIELVVRTLNYKRDQKRLDSLIVTAKMLAWGPRFRSIEHGIRKNQQDNQTTTDPLNKGTIVPPEKKVRIPLSGIEVPPLAPKKDGQDERAYWDEDEKAIRKAIASGVASNDPLGTASKRQIDVLVTRDIEVFILDPHSKEWTLLDDSAAPKPSFKSTWPFALATSVANKFTGGHSDLSSTANVEDEVEADARLVNGNGSRSATSSSGKKSKSRKKQQ